MSKGPKYLALPATFAASAFAVVVIASPAAAQAPAPSGGPGNAGERGGGDRERGSSGGGERSSDRGGRDFGGGDFRQRFSDRMKELMGASDDEWQVLSPRIERVQQLQRSASTGRSGMSMLFSRGGGSGGGRGGPGGGGSSRDFSRGAEQPAAPVEQKAKELQASIDNKGAGSDELKLKLAALREERDRARAETAKAQEELRELLTMRQEAILVMMGVLE